MELLGKSKEELREFCVALGERRFVSADLSCVVRGKKI